MSVQLHDTDRDLSSAFTELSERIPPEGITLSDLLKQLGEQGLLLFCVILTLPFLLPVSIPGVSTAFGLLIVLIGVGVLFNRIPWLPQRLMRKRVSATHLKAALGRGARMFDRISRVVRPRMLVLTHGPTVNRLNGFMLLGSGVLLMAPLAPIPFSNTLPAVAALLFALGILQRDGLAIIAGHVMVVATLAYFAVLFAGAYAAGTRITDYFGS